MSVKRFLVIGLLGYWVIGLAGCGYTTRSMISDKYRTIYIAPFVNKIDIANEADVASKYVIYKPMIETDITRRVVEKYLADGNLKPVKQETADLVLRGEVVEFRRDPVRYTDNEDVEEYRLNLVVNLILFDRRENKPLWEEKNFTGYANYFLTGPTAKPENTAISEALADLARRVVERTVEQW
jgi:outer membrane lipopolysaccharide assembly protein LptE/RlpB